MAYVVVVCSKCRRARGARESAKTARCPGCGRSLTLQKLRKYFRTSSLTDLAEAVGRMNAQLRGGLETCLGDRKEKGRGGTSGGEPQARGERERSSGAGEGMTEVGHVERTNGSARFREGEGVRGARLEKRVLEFLSRAGPSSAEKLAVALGEKISVAELELRLEKLKQMGLVYEPSPGKYSLVG
ncbi:MAG: DUF1922 domain-containing protein [Thermoplasmata archaeon]